MGGANAHYELIKVFSETDFTGDLQIIDAPVLVMSAELSVKLLKNGKLKAPSGPEIGRELLARSPAHHLANAHARPTRLSSSAY